MTGRPLLTNPNAPLRFDGEVVERHLRDLVEKIDATIPDMGGTPVAVEAWPDHERDLTGLAYRLFGALTADRWTYVDDAPGGGAST